MKTRYSLVAAASIAFIFLAMTGMASEAAELKVLSGPGMRAAMNDLGPKFERSTGHKLAITFARSPVLVKRIVEGASGDVVIIFREEIDNLVKDGKVGVSDVTTIARAGMGVAVRKGDPKPDISSPEAFKRMLLSAKSITYNDPAAGSHGGTHFAKVLDLLGIVEEMKAKTVFAVSTRRAGESVAIGDVQIVVQPIQDLMLVDGIEILGPLPGHLQGSTVFAAAVIAGGENLAASKALIDFLRTKEAATVFKTKGMDPASP